MNPFEKRATEYIRDDLAFLPYVTPEPLLSYLEKYAKEDVLFDRLVVLIGSPGSGKTTLARLFLFPTLTTLLRNKTLSSQTSLADALTRCKAIGTDGVPLVVGCRIPMESDFRDCWELPYEESVRNNLLCSLLQARAMLAWLRGLDEAGYDLNKITLIPRADAQASLDAIGGTSMSEIRKIAREVERDVYNVSASLLPPPASELPEGATSAYRPFDVLESFEIQIGSSLVRLKPLLICDDAHVLHPTQWTALVKWLARREIRVARWILTRIDALRPQDVLRPEPDGVANAHGISRGRDMVTVWMQNSDGRGANRRSFRKIAKDMAGRYLQQMPVFVRHGLTRLEDLLDGYPAPLSESKLKQLQDSLTTGPRGQISPIRRAGIEAMVDDYLSSGSTKNQFKQYPEIRSMMIRILLERYIRRTRQSSLFEEEIDSEPSMPLKVDSTIRNAAEMLLFQEFGRPFYYGFNTLCDAASENAEKFLRLAGHLVSQLETQIIRKSSMKLLPAVQDKILRERATRLVNEEDFSERTRVFQLCTIVSEECLTQTKLPNSMLSEGANAWGILQSEFDLIPSQHTELARVLQSGLAYNMFSLVRDYGAKGQIWCLLELSGPWQLRTGLSLKRGQFLERKVSDMLAAIGSST